MTHKTTTVESCLSPEERRSTPLQSLVESRLGLSMERGGLASSLEQYSRQTLSRYGLESEGALASLLLQQESLFDELVEAITVPHTWFFRDLEQLQSAISLVRQQGFRKGPTQVWVPACATGEDAYSLAVLARERNLAAEVLGTDINLAALRRARAGVFGAWSVRGIPASLSGIVSQRADRSYELVTPAREAVSFQRHNLLETPPVSRGSSGRWDLIVCRNILIYLTRAQARRVVENLKGALVPGGALILGASDIVFELPAGLEPVQYEGRLAFLLNPPQGTAPRLPAPTSPAEQVPLPPLLALPEIPSVSASVECVAPPPTPAALSAPSKALEEDTTVAQEHLQRGVGLYLGGAVQEAAKELRAALFLKDRLWPAAYYLALCYDALGQARDASRLYYRVAELLASGCPAPDSPEHDFRFLEQDVLRIARSRSKL